jgi:Opacity protein and related surface antigens
MRGRIGYRLDTIMPYVTGGVAWGSHEVTATGPAAGSWSGVQGGYAVGIGAELPAADDISLKLEYLYTRLEPHRFGAVSQDLEVHAFRVGLNFHF